MKDLQKEQGLNQRSDKDFASYLKNLQRAISTQLVNLEIILSITGKILEK